MQTIDRTKFEIGQIVHCETTYRKFKGQIMRPCVRLRHDLFERFIVLNLDDSKEYPVSVFGMTPFIEGSPETNDDTDSVAPLDFAKLSERDRSYLDWFADQCAQYGCD